MLSRGVNLVRFKVGAKDVRQPTHPWVDTDFWEVFDESEYDIVQTARAGHAEYPFTQINHTPIVDAITLPGMAERKKNVRCVFHISKFQLDSWVRAGGEAAKAQVIPMFREDPSDGSGKLRKRLELEGKFIFGMHQRDNDEIFSDIPLRAYAQIRNENTAFIVMGGGKGYRDQAQAIGVEDIFIVPHSGDDQEISEFLSSLNVYAHGRSDGETYSMAIAEAMFFGLPVISHAAPAMGHVETIGDGGVVVESVEDYAAEMKRLMEQVEYFQMRIANARRRYQEHLSIWANMDRIVETYERVSVWNA